MITTLKAVMIHGMAIVAMALAAGNAIAQSAIDQRLEKALRDLGFAEGKLPALKPAFGNYVDSVQAGNLLFLSSAAPQKPDGQFFKGRVPAQGAFNQAIALGQ